MRLLVGNAVREPEQHVRDPPGFVFTHLYRVARGGDHPEHDRASLLSPSADLIITERPFNLMLAWPVQGRWPLLRKWGTNVRQKPILDCTDALEVLSCRREAQPIVRTSSYLVGIVLVLSVILPEANGADLVAAPLRQGDVGAAGAGVRPARR